MQFIPRCKSTTSFTAAILLLSWDCIFQSFGEDREKNTFPMVFQSLTTPQLLNFLTLQPKRMTSGSQNRSSKRLRENSEKVESGQRWINFLVLKLKELVRGSTTRTRIIKENNNDFILKSYFYLTSERIWNGENMILVYLSGFMMSI